MTNRFAAAILLAGAVSLGACAKKAPEQLPPSPTETAAPDAGLDTGPAGPVLGTQEHFAEAVGTQNTVVYFDTDRFNIDEDDMTKLQAQAAYFSQNSALTFTVEGHADERGTREYNLALGERRANAAKNYLVSLGIPESRIRTLSYGKERPVALGSDESAWALNRRAATVVIN